MTQDPQFDFQVTDADGVKIEKEKYVRQLKLEEMFADADPALKDTFREAQDDPIDDLVYNPEPSDDE